jgi:hypothetical protein
LWDRLTSLWTARGLVILGFLAGYVPVGSTFGHIGDERYSPTHSWHHFFREGFGDLGAMVAILVILFAAPRFRNPLAWWVMLILMLGFYAPFWVGVPFLAELAAPSMSAEIAHLTMAVPSLLGCFLARRHFPPTQQPAAQLG